MAGNTFGSIFRITTFGESHGPAIGVVIDGCPPLLDLNESDIQIELDRRRPGQVLLQLLEKSLILLRYCLEYLKERLRVFQFHF